MASIIPSVSHSGASSAGAGASVDFATAKAHVSMVLTTSGELADGLLVVEASHDGTNWVSLHRMALTSKESRGWNLGSGAYRYFRTRIEAAVDGGGRVSTTFMEAD